MADNSLGGLGLPKVERPVFPLPPGDPLDAPFRDQPFVVRHPFARGEGKSLTPEQVVLRASLRGELITRDDKEAFTAARLRGGV